MALTVGKLKEILNTLDNDVPIVVENAWEQFYIKESDVSVEEIYEHTGDRVSSFKTIIIYAGDHY